MAPLTETEIAVLRRVHDGSGRASTDGYVAERLYADGLIGSAGVTAAGRHVLVLLDHVAELRRERDALSQSHETDLEHLGRMTRICEEQRAQLAQLMHPDETMADAAERVARERDELLRRTRRVGVRIAAGDHGTREG